MVEQLQYRRLFESFFPSLCSSTLQKIDEETQQFLVMPKSDTDVDKDLGPFWDPMFTSSNGTITDQREASIPTCVKAIWPSDLQIWVLLLLVYWYLLVLLVYEWWDPLWLVQLALVDAGFIFCSWHTVGLQYGWYPKWLVSYCWDLYPMVPLFADRVCHWLVTDELCLHGCFSK